MGRGRGERECKNWGSRCFLSEAGEFTADHARDSNVIVLVVNCYIQYIIKCYNDLQNY